jgi:hypothetical protein
MNTFVGCNPDFVEAREAILKADALTNAGHYYCDIWRGFGKRGLGKGSLGHKFEDSFQIPSTC